MRKSLIAVPLGLSLLLAGCSSEPAPTPAPTASASTEAPTPEPAPTVALSADELVLESVEVGPVTDGTAPTLSVPAPVYVEAPATRVLTEGKGEEVVGPGSLVTVRTTAIAGDGTAVPDTTFWTEPLSLSLTSTAPEIRDALVGSSAGSVLLVGSPSADGTRLTLLDVVGVRGPRAWGAEVAPVPGLPTVARSPATGEPTITVPAGFVPSGVTVQPLLLGDGPAVAAGDRLDAQIVSQATTSATPTSSTWATGPTTIALHQGELLPVIEEALVGIPRGSQVLVVLPADAAYGEAQPDTYGMGDLAYVIDVLA